MIKEKALKRGTLKGSNKQNLSISELKSIPFGVKIEGIYTPPPSKSFAIRNLIVASLAENESLIKNIGYSDDVKSALQVIKKWRNIRIYGNDVLVSKWKNKISEGKYFVKDSALLARILLALFSFLEGKRVIDGNENLRKRDLSSSIESARKTGAKITEIDKKGKLPVVVEGKIFKKNRIEIKDRISSQFSSGVLISLAFLKKKCEVKIEKEISFPYIKMTEETLKKFGAKISSSRRQFYLEKSILKGTEIEVEKDFSAAAFFGAGALVTEGSVKIFGLNKKSSQGDKKFFEIIKKAGATVNWENNYVEVSGLPKQGIKVDLKNYPDLLPPLSVVALKCPSESIFHGILRLKAKESSRAEEIAETINKIGGKAVISENILKIYPSKNYKGIVLDPKDDHRLAMAYALVATFTKGIKLKNFECVNKSYPSFWIDFSSLINESVF